MTPFTATRRQFLGAAGLSLGPAALASLAADRDSLLPRQPHFKPKAERVIYLHMSGAPPHLDLLDYKPELVKRDGQNCPESVLKGRRFAFTSGVPKLLGTRRKFVKAGKSGLEMSDAIPHLHEIADECSVVRSLTTDQFNHAPAELLLFTGSARPGRPSFGAWATYGLGSVNQNLPGFVALISSGVQPSGGQGCWGSGFLPGVFQGIQCRSQGDPVPYSSDPPGMNRALRRDTLDALNDLNRMQANSLHHPETETRISQYELAFRMQTEVPGVMDISKETKETLAAYGAVPGQASFANNCLLARRLAEKGVRFVHLFDWGWDFHGTNPAEDIRDGLTKKCAVTGKPVAALIKDLKRLGMLDSTLVIWGGEFGRTPFREGRTATSAVLGRDHYPDVYSLLLCGGGVKKGYTHGASDDLGFAVADKKVHVHDLQATLLHLLGFDHEKLSYRFQGRDHRLTDVHGHVVTDLVA
jgi:hypothetical protein